MTFEDEYPPKLLFIAMFVSMVAFLVTSLTSDPSVRSMILLPIGFIILGLATPLLVVPLLRPYDPLDTPEDPKTCPNCMAAYESPDSTFCWNCGMDFGASSEVKDIRRESLERYKWVEARQFEESKRSISIGKCMVCKFVVKGTEEAAWCPRCGAIAHRDHFLEWLHVKHTCPVCKEHLHEELLRRLISQGVNQE